jgi:hypothetical protein
VKIIFTVLLLVSAVSAGGVNLADYTTPNDGLDDSPGFQKAIADLPAGGTIIVGAGTWNLNSPVSFVTYTNSNNSYTIKGQKGAVIKPDLTPWQTLFVSGNQNQINFEDLLVIGDENPGDDDFDKFLYVAYTSQLRIKGCQFIGLKSRSSLIFVANTDAVIRDTLFMGLASGDGVLRTDESKGLSVIDSEFFDYAAYNGAYYSKTPSGNPAWIKVTATKSNTNAMAQRGLFLNNVRFDEGARHAVIAIGTTYVQANSVMVNVPGIDGSGGVYLSDVKYAEIKASHFGYSQYPRPAVKAFNNTVVSIDAVSLGDKVFYGTRDQSSQAFFNLRACNASCSFTIQQ